MKLFDLSLLQTTQDFGTHETAFLWMIAVSIFMFVGPATLGTAVILFLRSSMELKPKRDPKKLMTKSVKTGRPLKNAA